MVYSTSLTYFTLLQPDITLINNIIEIQHGSSNNSKLYTKFTCNIYLEGNQCQREKLLYINAKNSQ